MQNRIQRILGFANQLLLHLFLLLLRHESLGLDTTFLAKFLECFFCHFLTENLLYNELLARASIAAADDDAGGDVACKTETQDNGGEFLGAIFVVDSPGRATECALEHGVTVEEDDDGNEEADRKGVVCVCFVGTVEGMGLLELALMVFKSLLLFSGEDGGLYAFLFCFICFPRV